MEDPDPRKPHRVAHSGRKAQKKEEKKKKNHDQVLSAKQRNPKAFAIQSATKAERRFRRTMDIKSKGYHVPTVDRTPAKPPPTIVAIVGPPKVGKTTLLKCLIRNFTRQKMTTIDGPVTLVSGKKKRITFIECSNDINMMIDVAKIADLVLLMIDAKSGFEMEIFEFLNICQVHGMPRLMGVLTHLDLFKNKKVLQKTKTILKKRYRLEIPRGEKMFYLSGIMYGEYLKNEVHNLGRFISVMKFELSAWKKSHPYVLVDRMEDITNPELQAKEPVCNRRVCLYGYARGGALKRDSFYHIPGCGDYIIKHINFLPDPCPLPDKQKKRSLNEKERLIYAPMCGVGGIVYDKDAVYIETKENKNDKKSEDNNPSDKLVDSLVSAQQTIDEKMKATQIQLFPGEEPLDNDMSSESEDEEGLEESDQEETSEDEDAVNDKSESEVSDVESDEMSDSEKKLKRMKKVRFADEVDGNLFETSRKRKLKSKDDSNKKLKLDDESINTSSDDEDDNCDVDISEEEDDNEEEVEIGHVKWKHNIIKKAADDFYERQKDTISLQRLVYGESRDNTRNNGESDSDSENEIGGLFRVAKHEQEKKSYESDNGVECSKFVAAIIRDWTDEKIKAKIKDCFVTGKWSENEDAEHLLEEDEAYGDFEDYEKGVLYKGKESAKEISDDEIEDKENDAKDEAAEAEKEKTRYEKRMEKKKKLKELFNKQFDDAQEKSFHDDLKMEADAQCELNKKEFEDLDDDLRIHFEGYRAGLYLRLEIEEMPCEFVKNFDPAYPVIIGSLSKGEDKMGYLQVRIKKHRWYPRILKSRDPLVLSVGWRRFQTIPLYYIVDHNLRNRHLKYTPKHLHCMAAFWGPITQQKSGVLGVQTVSEISREFRVAAAGSVTEINQTTNIVKKLKLLGHPSEIFKKTAFIEGMFHSVPETAKYEGAAIRTVSGIRGQIKKALRVPPGNFRATFEDKILKSDVVFLRTWVTVTVPQFCITVTSLLLPPGQKVKWEGVRTLGKLRYDKGLHAPVSEDSKYTPVERKFRQFAPLVVPKTLQKALPFKDKIIHKSKKAKDSKMERVAVIKEPHERQVSKVLNMLKTVYDDKEKKEKKAMWLRARAHRKQKRKDEAIHHQKVQQMKKRILRKKTPKKTDS